MPNPLNAEQLHQLYRLENGLAKLHEAQTRFNSMLADFDPNIRQLPEFFLQRVELDLTDARHVHELAEDQAKAERMVAA